MSETTVDAKGRVVVPEEIRKKLKIGQGTKVGILLEGNDGPIRAVRTSMGPQKFIDLTKGVIKEEVQSEPPTRFALEIWQSS
jgi:AbrB family looped-hinge helix DNA binding protein